MAKKETQQERGYQLQYTGRTTASVARFLSRCSEYKSFFSASLSERNQSYCGYLPFVAEYSIPARNRVEKSVGVELAVMLPSG